MTGSRTQGHNKAVIGSSSIFVVLQCVYLQISRAGGTLRFGVNLTSPKFSVACLHHKLSHLRLLNDKPTGRVSVTSCPVKADNFPL